MLWPYQSALSAFDFSAICHEFDGGQLIGLSSVNVAVNRMLNLSE
jgi:hypothetical protein